MKLSNFRCYERSGKGPTTWRYHAKVDVTTGMMFWKRTIEREIARPYGGYWFFVADGEFTPGAQVENLERAANAQLGDKALA